MGSGFAFLVVEPNCRFAGELLEHHTFALIDLGGNWLEFKHDLDAEAALGRRECRQVGDAALR